MTSSVFVAYSSAPLLLNNCAFHLCRLYLDISRDQPVRKGPTRSTADNAHAGQIKKGTVVEVQVCGLQPDVQLFAMSSSLLLDT